MTYTHRNGETDAPTTPGAYWIRGHDYDGVYRMEIVNVWKHANGISVWDIRTESHQPVNFYSAQWWGPIVAPWEQSQ
jgi:hypothetical protein